MADIRKVYYLFCAGQKFLLLLSTSNTSATSLASRHSAQDNGGYVAGRIGNLIQLYSLQICGNAESSMTWRSKFEFETVLPILSSLNRRSHVSSFKKLAMYIKKSSLIAHLPFCFWRINFWLVLASYPMTLVRYSSLLIDQLQISRNKNRDH